MGKNKIVFFLFLYRRCNSCWFHVCCCFILGEKRASQDYEKLWNYGGKTLLYLDLISRR